MKGVSAIETPTVAVSRVAWSLMINQVSVSSAISTKANSPDWPSVAATSTDRFHVWFSTLLEEGFYMAPSPYEAAFFSAAHTHEHMERFLAAAERTLAHVHAEVPA